MDSSLENMSKKELLEQINRLEKEKLEVEKENSKIQQVKNTLEQKTIILEEKLSSVLRMRDSD
jgi:hypothetical protein